MTFHLEMYKKRHYYESKVLHNNEVIEFSAAYCSVKAYYFLYEFALNVVDGLIMLLLTPLKQKLIDYSLKIAL